MTNEAIRLKSLYDNVVEEVTQDSEKWVDFLKFHSGIHKYPFDQAVLVYAQKPDAEMIASQEIWEKLGRSVNEKENGILVFKYINGRQTRVTLYDVYQTSGRPLQRPEWRIQDRERGQVLKLLSRDNEANYTLKEVINDLSDDIALSVFKRKRNDLSNLFDEEYLNDMENTLKKFMVENTRYMVSERSGFNQEPPDELSLLTELHNNRSLLSAVGFLIQTSAMETMQAIAEAKQNRKPERIDSLENAIRDERERAASAEHTNEQPSRGRSADRQVRQDGDDLSPGNQSDPVHPTPNGRNASGKDAQDQRTSKGSDDDVDQTNDEGNAGAGDSGHIGKDPAHQPTKSPSGGNSDQRDRLQQLDKEQATEPENQSGSFILDKIKPVEDEQVQLDLFNNWDEISDGYEEQPKNEDDKVPDGSISQEEIDTVLLKGSGFEQGKFRINDFFSTKPSIKEAAAFLKNEYGIGGWSGPGSVNVGFNSRNLTLSKNRVSELILPWPAVAKRLQQLIEMDGYLTNDEKEERERLKQAGEQQVENEFGTEEPEEVQVNKEEQVQNYRYQETDELYPSGEKAKYRNNVAAIRLLKQLESENKIADPEGQKVLARYVGWGGLANVFSRDPGKWEKEQNELKVLLTDKEYREAMVSTITAYYTDQNIVKSIYQVLENLGFQKGKILDPAMGTGNFFSVLPEGMGTSSLTGVELDSITGRIAKQLYPLANVKVQGYETTAFKDNEFDVVIGNIPFNNIEIPDARYDEHKFLIHDYFIAKSLDVVKPGGVVAVITSKGTLDKKSTDVREYIAERSNLLGAVRLPNTAFKAIAGTEATSDILFLQKRETLRDLSQDRPTWIDTATLPDAIGVNRYFVENADMMLGKMKMKGYYNGSLQYTCVPEEGKELSTLLDETIPKINGRIEIMQQETIDENKQEQAENAEVETLEAPFGLRNFTYHIQDDQVYYVEGRRLIKQTLNKKITERIKGMCGIREALLDVIDVQVRDAGKEALFDRQNVLSERYDEFVKKHGRLNENANMKAFVEDGQLPMLLSIENETKENTYEKAEIFYKATIRPRVEKRKAENAQEALEMCLNNKRNVNLEYMSRIYGKDVETIIQELGDLIFLNPEKYNGNISKGWEFKDDYLTGNVYDKLQYARDKAEDFPDLFERNVRALEDVQPPKLLPGDIHFQIGSSWIPKQYYQEFMYDLFETEFFNKPDIHLEYLEYTNTWKVEGKSREPGSVKVNSVYGTGRKNAYELFEDALNLQDATVRDPVPYRDDNGNEKIKYVVNPKETMIARSKQNDIQQAFSNWLFKYQARSADLLEIYNSTFNTIRPRVYDGRFLNFPDMNAEFSLRTHQRNAVARGMSAGNALLAHEVGAGKTATMIATAMKLKQIGAARKPMFVVMNHTIEQWKNEFMRFYPGANILVATKRDFQKRNRQKFVSKIAMGEYDGVIIGHSQFEKIQLSQERQEETIRRDIQTLTYEIDEAKREQGNDWSVKQLVTFQKRLENRLTKLQNRDRKDDILDFEALGVDTLFVDEAHNYKNLFTFTKLTNVAGIGTSSSQRASDLKMKCEYIQEQNQGRGLFFATGTPVSNSMSELHVMQRYLQPEVLRRAGLEFFDKWAGTFGEIVSSLEMTPEGSGYRMRSRFAKFHNLPELMNTFSLVADIQTAEMLKLPTPELENGEAKIVVSTVSDFQKQKMDEFVERAEAIRNGEVNPTEDNMLKVTHEAKLMAIDPRLFDETAPVDDTSKLSLCTENVYRIWQDTQEDKLTQIIFCDSGTPKPHQFNAYDEVKRQLMEKGVPEEEIAFIHDAKTDAQRDALFEDVRNGDVRVILGSTSKVGTGTNIQDKLVAGHHIDCPWRPSDITQRDGRILRQGNTNEKVKIFRYVTKGTFDGYLWQIQEQKSRFIAQVMTGKSISRSVDDLDETVLTAAEVKAIATDNPLLLEKMTLDNDINRLTMVKNRWMNEKATMQKNVDRVYPERIEKYKRQIKAIQSDMGTMKEKSQTFKILIGKQPFYDLKEAGIALNEFVASHPFEKDGSLNVGTYKGMSVFVKRDVFGDKAVGLKGNSSYEVRLLKSEKANIERLMGLEDLYPEEVKRLDQSIEETQQQIVQTKNELDKPFSHEDELNDLLKKQAELNLKMEFEQEIKKQEEEAREASKEAGHTMSVSQPIGLER